MNLVLTDFDRRLLAEGVAWASAHYDLIEYYYHELPRERISELASLLVAPETRWTGRDIVNLNTLAVALLLLLEDGLPMAEADLEPLCDRMHALAKEARKWQITQPPPGTMKH